MICGCIDIGSNTTRLLVAEPADGRLRELLRQRAFTRIGKGLRRDDTIPAEKITEVAEVVATQVRLARELGTDTIRAVATAAIREASNQEEFTRAIAENAGVAVEVVAAPGLLTTFFSSSPIVDYSTARACDLEAHASWCRALLARGVYPPPSQFEA